MNIAAAGAHSCSVHAFLADAAVLLGAFRDTGEPAAQDE